MEVREALEERCGNCALAPGGSAGPDCPMIPNASARVSGWVFHCGAFTPAEEPADG